jgi:Golgi nucleoside diphosphatase
MLAAAKSLIPLLDDAVALIPPELRAITPVNLKATAGLRLLKLEERYCVFVC